MANSTNSYYLYQKYEKRGSQDWIPYYPNTYSVDGDGTMPVVLKQENDTACGYVPPPEIIYRWINLDPSVYYYCLECGTDELKVSGTYGTGDTFSANCNNSTELTASEIPSGVTYAKVGSCVTKIGGAVFPGLGAFEERHGLSGVSLPSSVTVIGARAFANSDALINCVLPDSVTTIQYGAFSGCSSLSNIILWDTITSIGNSAFTDCDSIISINIPAGITTIPQCCFRGCGALSEVTIPSGVTNINGAAFSGCTGLAKVTVKATTPPRLESGVFRDTNNCPIYVPCESLEDYIAASSWSDYRTRLFGIPPCAPPRFAFKATYLDNTSYEVRCTSATTSLGTGITRAHTTSYEAMTSAEVGECIETIYRAFQGCTKLSACTIGTGVTLIGTDSFNDCSSLISITIPNNVTSIGARAFYGCTGLTDISLPDNIATIATSTFDYCYSLSSITIPNSVTTIGESAFMRCRSLSAVTIPSGVTSIGSSAFTNSSNLETVTVEATTPPTLGTMAFVTNTALQNPPYPTIYVPASAVDTYKSTSGWSYYASKILPITS